MKKPACFLLDTCVVSENAYRNPSETLITWLRGLPNISFAISVATVVEIQRGIEKLRLCGSWRALMYEEWLVKFLSTDITCLDQDIAISRLIGRMTSVPALRGLWVPTSDAKDPKLGQDIWIAATAIIYDLPIATMNIRDFLLIHQYFPLPGLFDPTRLEWHIQ